MTNEKLKQQAIQEAYGKHWDEVKSFIGLDGSIPYEVALWCSPNKDTWDILPDGYYIPKKINGILDNNGWIRIEQDGSNLPESGKYHIITRDNNDIGTYVKQYGKWLIRGSYYGDTWQNLGITHYRPLVEYPKPVY